MQSFALTCLAGKGPEAGSHKENIIWRCTKLKIGYSIDSAYWVCISELPANPLKKSYESRSLKNDENKYKQKINQIKYENRFSI